MSAAKLSDAGIGVLRYSRAFTLSVEALHTLCCTSGSMRERLQQVDPEFFGLRDEQLPQEEDVQAKFAALRELVTRNPSRWEGEGSVPATLAQAHQTKLQQMAQLVWEVHQGFSRFMNGAV